MRATNCPVSVHQLPNRLKHLRAAQGLSLVALAAKVGASSQQISHLELGKRQLTVEWLSRLAQALDCHPWSIVSAEVPPGLTGREAQLLEAFSALTEGDQEAVLGEVLTKAWDLLPGAGNKRPPEGQAAE